MSEFVKTSLHELVQDPISGSRPKGGVNNEGDIPSFGGENITMSGGVNFYPVKKVTAEFFQNMNRGHLRNLDVLINKDGANTGKSAIYRNSPYQDASINEHLFILRGLEEKLDQEYLHYLLQLSSVRATLETKITGSAQPGLNSTFVKSFAVEVAPLPEQKKIASILTSVDEVIEKTQSQIDKLQDLKKGTMNELLTKGIGHTEFKDSELGRIPKSWEVVPINELVSIPNGQVDPKIEPYASMPHIGSGNIISWTGEILDVKSASVAGQISGKYQFTSKHLLYSKVRPNLAKVCFPKFEGICSADIYPLLPKDGVCAEFLFHYLLTDVFTKTAMVVSERTGMPKINREDLNVIKIPKAPYLEQVAISEIITSIDNSLADKKRYLYQTQSLKKSLMQDLLTGKVRVSVN